MQSQKSIPRHLINVKGGVFERRVAAAFQRTVSPARKVFLGSPSRSHRLLTSFSQCLDVVSADEDQSSD